MTSIRRRDSLTPMTVLGANLTPGTVASMPLSPGSATSSSSSSSSMTQATSPTNSVKENCSRQMRSPFGAMSASRRSSAPVVFRSVDNINTGAISSSLNSSINNSNNAAIAGGKSKHSATTPLRKSTMGSTGPTSRSVFPSPRVSARSKSDTFTRELDAAHVLSSNNARNGSNPSHWQNATAPRQRISTATNGNVANGAATSAASLPLAIPHRKPCMNAPSSFHQSRQQQQSRSTPTSAMSIMAVLKYLPAMLLMTLPWIPTSELSATVATKQDESFRLHLEHNEVLSKLEKLTHDMHEKERQRQQLERTNHALFQALHPKISAELLAQEKYSELERVETAMLGRIDGMEKQIQDSARRKMEQRFGRGPYHIEMMVRKAEGGILSGQLHKVVLETALTTEMPHAIHHFLQMIDTTLWEGMTLMKGDMRHASSLSSPSTITVTPMKFVSTSGGQQQHHTSGQSSKAATAMPTLANRRVLGDGIAELQSARQQFVDAELTHLAFEEFSDTFPPPHHNRRYSVAFPSHSGPDWTIQMDEDDTSKSSNSHRNHMSTFAMVVEGSHVLEEFVSSPSAAETALDGSGDSVLVIHSIKML